MSAWLKTILVSPLPRLALLALAAGTLAACGQKGNLYLPTGQEAVGRASLPQVLLPDSLLPGSLSPAPSSTMASPSAAPASAPADPSAPARSQ